MNKFLRQLSVSNLAWAPEHEKSFLKAMTLSGFTNLEIAPTKFIGINPYDEENTKLAVKKGVHIEETFGITVSSMQSIWFKREEQMFGSKKERTILLEYSRSAFEFASALRCPHIVFGNPKNRHGASKLRNQIALEFFAQISDLADEFGIEVGIEPIPTLYQNDYLTSFLEVKNFVEILGSKKVGLNYDFGSLLVNDEKTAISDDYLKLATHFHISEPNLSPIVQHSEHKELAELLEKSGNKKGISVEMLEVDLETFKKVLKYVRKIFGSS
jgi:sugar phosphate isomerase/epimerase